MVTKLRLVFSITIVFLSFYASAQSKYWEASTVSKRVQRSVLRGSEDNDSKIFTLRENLFKEELKSSITSKKTSHIVYFPNSNGEMVAYRVHESPVLSPKLSEKYPEIKSYSGRALNDSQDRVRFSISPNDVQAMIVSSKTHKNSFIEKNEDQTYVLYSKSSDWVDKSDFVCSTADKVMKAEPNLTAKPLDGQVLRKYRLAISATAEYTQYHGGTVADALAAINATLTRVNEVFETDLAVRLELVSDTDKIIYTDSSSDPYTGSLSLLGEQAQNAMTSEIGEANYDLGHVFHKGENGGNAGFIGAICVDNRKGSAYSSSLVPKGDKFDLDFVAHELGHQLGANHTWSHENEGTQVQVEPGSGSTIMGYAGITGVNDVAARGDDYFHYISIKQIIDNLKDKSCGEVISIANTPPEVAPLEDYVIPKSTPFVLEGSATDADAGDVLTYTWEQVDNGIVTNSSFGPNNASGANFRSRLPSSVPVRYFPMLSRVIQGRLTETFPTRGSAWETVSDVERDMNFAFTVRDNAAGGGQVVSELMNVQVVNSAGPFKVTSQATPQAYVAGEVIEIDWDVAGTDKLPIATKKVDIMLSVDGGISFSEPLATGVDNNGTHKVVLPGVTATKARIMVKAADNIYYAVNDADFSIAASPFIMNFSELEYEACHFDDLIIPFIYETYSGFNEEVTFQASDVPDNLGISFTPATTSVGGTPVDILLENTENVPEGAYSITISAVSASLTKDITFDLNIYDDDFPEVGLNAPVDGAIDVSINELLEWEEDPSYTAYEVHIATDAAFSNLVELVTVNTNSYVPAELSNQTQYYWRVKPLNACGGGPLSATRSFTTIQVDCTNKRARDLPLEIVSTQRSTVISKIAFFEDLKVDDIDVRLDIDHEYLEDLVVTLTSPSNTVVPLFSSSCGKLRNVDATFDDSASDFVCGTSSSAAIQGRVKPLGSLSAFKGESVLGEWTLTVIDNASGDGGVINSFSLDICVEGEFRPDVDDDGVFDDGDDLCLNTPPGVEVDVSGCQVFRFPSDNFVITVESETCRNNDDGMISLTAALPLDYTVTVTGNGQDVTDTFTSDFELLNLSSGTYTLCINASTPEFDYEPFCVEVTVSQPEPLGVSSSVSSDGKQLVLAMEGADLYTIELNGETLLTDKSEVTLDLKSGSNTLRVSTGLACQGIHEDSFFVAGDSVVFPNPFDEITKILLRSSTETVRIDIFTLAGRLARSTEAVPRSGAIDLDFTGLPSGIYLVRVEGETIKGVVKVIKR
ncbi:Por secretion system C-terminal sorting domain-containing protein [Zobellia uliginosa]|uniref:Por secretion system C-terminal sorting domain-containing protein n=1 Tax=Zobellia uliginosa TaxID=143224 RepID=A0ABY1L1N9_9FLAO|nr:zinc-dependent metalloprotease family protein [Zobellia uliginosa]SIT06842.1 Por secretion system C-terminal sorting domain-containing protein [Zobellia uliginosa]